MKKTIGKNSNQGFVTAHAAKANQFKVHPNVLTACQRRGALPREIADFSEEDDLFLERLSRIVGNQRLIQLQLRMFSTTRQDSLLAETPDVADYKRWERRAIDILVQQYQAMPDGGGRPSADLLVVMDELQQTHKTVDSEKNRQRLKELRKIAYDRVFVNK